MGCAESREATALNAGEQQDGADVLQRSSPPQCPAAPGPHSRLPGPLSEDDERRRLQALLDCHILDTPDERRFDAVTRLLASVFRAPVAVVGLIDRDRLWLKSLTGLDGREGVRPHSFCEASLRLPCPSMMVVPDTLADARFQRNQFVLHHGVRFYCGAPLVSSEGFVLGSLAVLDVRPRTMPAEVANLMCNFAELVVRELERDKVGMLRWRQEVEHLQTVRALEAFDEAVLLCDVAAAGWPIRFVNTRWCEDTGIDETAGSVWAVFHFACPADTAQLIYAYAAIEEGKPFVLHVAPGKCTAHAWPCTAGPPPRIDGAAQQVGGQDSSASGSGSAGGAASAATSPVWVVEFRPATADHISQACPHIAIPSFVQMGPQKLHPGEQAVPAPTSLYFATAKQKLNLKLGQLGPVARGLQPTGVATAPAPPQPLLLPALEAGQEAQSPMPKLQVLPRTPLLRGSALGPQTPVAGQEREPQARQGCTGLCSSEACDTPKLPPTPISVPWSPRPFGQERPKELELEGLELGPLLGRGAHGRVYRGVWRDGEKVAVKILDCFVDAGSQADSPSGEGPVLEATLGKSLGEHPNVATTHTYAVCQLPEQHEESGRIHQEVWIVQEYCDRGTLNDAIDRGWLRESPAEGAPLDARSVLATAQDIASALAFLHSRSMIHGDLSGGNVLLVTDGDDPRGFHAKVSDFGVSRLLGSIDCQTATFGTVSHMPPELLKEGQLSRATDCYSWGVLCWEMLTSSHAWAGCRVAQIVLAKTVQRQELEVPEALEGCPPDFQALVERCLLDDPSRRPTFFDIVGALATMLAQ